MSRSRRSACRMWSESSFTCYECYAASGVVGGVKVMKFIRFFACIAFLVPAAVRADDPPKAETPAKPKYERRRAHDPNGIGKFYLDREIAQVMGHSAAD